MQSAKHNKIYFAYLHSSMWYGKIFCEFFKEQEMF